LNPPANSCPEDHVVLTGGHRTGCSILLSNNPILSSNETAVFHKDSQVSALNARHLNNFRRPVESTTETTNYTTHSRTKITTSMAKENESDVKETNWRE